MTISAFVIRLLFLAMPGILASKVYKKLRGRPAREVWETLIEIMIFSFASYALIHAFGGDHPDSAGTLLTVEAIPPFTIQSPQPVPFVGPPEYSVPATRPTSISAPQNSKIFPVTFRVENPITVASTQPVTVDGSPPTVFGANQTVTIQPAHSSTPSASVFEAFLNEQEPIGCYVETIAWATFAAMCLAIAASYVHKFSLVNRFGRFIRASNRADDEDAWSGFTNSDDIEWVFVRDIAKNRVYYGKLNLFSDSEKPKELVLEDVQVYSNDEDELLYCVKAIYLSREDGDWIIEVPPNT